MLYVCTVCMYVCNFKRQLITVCTGTELKYNEVNHQMIKDDDILLKYSGKEPTVENVQCIRDQVLVKLPPKEESNSAGKYSYIHTYIHTYIIH